MDVATFASANADPVVSGKEPGFGPSLP